MTPPSNPPNPPQPAGKAAFWCFLLYLAFVIYGSLVPLQFVDRTLASAIQAFREIPFLTLNIASRADWVANLLLFIPLTFLAALATNARGGHPARRILLPVTIGAAAIGLAIGIEFTQLYFPQRTVSQNDIYAESLGGLIGLLVYSGWGARVRAWLNDFWLRQQGQDRLVKLLQAYLVLLLLFNILPLDLTLSPVELFHKWKEGRVVLIPFAGLTSDRTSSFAEAFYELGSDILIWLPVGLLLALRSGATLAGVALAGLGAGLAIEFLQLFVYSRVTDVTDVLLAGVGACGGWLPARALAGNLPALAARFERASAFLWLGWLILAAGVFWYPFNFDLARLSTDATTTAFSRLPFTTYYFTSEFHAINELLRKLSFFLPGGLLLGLMAQGRRQSAALPLALLALIAFGIEAGQLALPGKVADLTDALLESLGGWLGYLMGRWIGAPPLRNPAPRRDMPAAPPPPRSQDEMHRAMPSAGPHPRPRPRPEPAWLTGPRGHLVIICLMTLTLAAALRLPFIPYNLRELLRPELGGLISAAGISLAAYGIANGMFLLFPRERRVWLLAFPAVLLIHGLAAFILLRIGVPIESLHDIVGAPVLGWPWEFEMLGRYLALHLCLMLPLLGAGLMVRALLNPAALADFIYWFVITLALAWPLHFLVIEQAATDNLTELIADNAGFLASCALAGAFFLTGLAASALSALSALSSRSSLSAPGVAPATHARRLAAIGLLAAIGAAALFGLGAEQNIVKYGRVFSAFQFLLSPDRDHLASGLALAMREGIALLAACAGLALLQWMSWRQYGLKRTAQPTRRGRRGS